MIATLESAAFVPQLIVCAATDKEPLRHGGGDPAGSGLGLDPRARIRRLFDRGWDHASAAITLDVCADLIGCDFGTVADQLQR
jgi:hypothetical protein